MKTILLFIAVGLFVAPILANEGSWDTPAVPVEMTNIWSVALTKEGLALANQVAEMAGLTHIGRHAGLSEAEIFPNVVMFEKRAEGLVSALLGDEITKALLALPFVEWAERDVVRTHIRRSVDPVPTPTDPLYASEWHLTRINAQQAWRNYGGRGVQIAVVDDGLNWNGNADFPRYMANYSYDVNYNDPDPTPFSYDIHGTEAAGVACAADDGVQCGVGVAPHASLSAIRLIAKGTVDSDEATGLSYMTDYNDIYSCSWGPTDDGQRMEGPGHLTYNAFVNNVATGRQGKGSIYVWAGGNGRANGDNCNYDGYANLPETIAIGALDSNNKVSYYSEPCAALVACAPSSGASDTKKISTSKTSKSCSTTFGGTSAAAPMAAGLIALALEANPSLTWRDVQAVIIESAVQVDSGSYGWAQNGAGYMFSHDYGFGLIEADQLVAEALVHTNLPARQMYRTDSQAHDSSLSTSFTFTIPASFGRRVEHVELYLAAISTRSRGKLSIVLTSPSGMRSILQQGHNDVGSNLDWTYMSIAHWGESAIGDWTLSLTSTVAFSVTETSLTIFGH